MNELHTLVQYCIKCYNIRISTAYAPLIFEAMFAVSRLPRRPDEKDHDECGDDAAAGGCLPTEPVRPRITRRLSHW